MKYLIGLICLALPAYLIRFSIFGIPTTLLEILIYIVFIIGLFNLKNRQKIAKSVYSPVILFLIAGLVSVYISPDKTVALGQFKALFIDPLMIAWLVLSYLKASSIDWSIWGLAGSSLIVSVYSVTQKLLGNVTVDNRVVGIFGYNPNYTALFLAPIIIVTSIWFLVISWQKKNYVTLGFGIFLSAINFTALYLTGSRGGLLALVGGVVFYLILKFWPIIRTKLWLKLGIGTIIIVSIIMAFWVFKPNFSLDPAVGGRITSSNNIRVQIWQTSLELGAKHPFLGLGLGNYQNAFSDLTKNRVNFPEFITPLALTPHNLFLMFWLSTGILGLIAFVWLVIIFFRIGFKKTDNFVSLALMAAMSVIIIQGLVDTPYFKNDLSLIFWLIVGFVLILNKD